MGHAHFVSTPPLFGPVSNPDNQGCTVYSNTQLSQIQGPGVTAPRPPLSLKFNNTALIYRPLTIDVANIMYVGKINHNLYDMLYYSLARPHTSLVPRLWLKIMSLVSIARQNLRMSITVQLLYWIFKKFSSSIRASMWVSIWVHRNSGAITNNWYQAVSGKQPGDKASSIQAPECHMGRVQGKLTHFPSQSNNS